MLGTVGQPDATEDGESTEDTAASLTSDSVTLTSCSCSVPDQRSTILPAPSAAAAAAAQATIMPVTGQAARQQQQQGGEDSTCLELALEGERLCKGGECRLGVQFLEAAVQVGTDDLRILSAVYSQLGNAHFYLQDYMKALEYHTLDLSLARAMGDKAGEAKASGNLGNTLKVLGKFEEASMCCLRHLELARELGDRMGEARALYNLGNVHHAHGKHTGRVSHQQQAPSASSSEGGANSVSCELISSSVRESLRRAADFYEQNLAIVRDLGDRAGVGRACGNLGNTHYLLGNFHEAIRYHTERLAVAKEFGDRGAERRAHSNLGNAHILLGELDTAADHYKRCLALARQLGEPALEAQACYSLGNTCTLMRDYRQAIDYHSRHMRIAEQLGDRVGEARACWSLGNAHAAVGDNARALEFARRHLELSLALGDDIGVAAARLNLADLRHLLGMSPSDVPVDELPPQQQQHSQSDALALDDDDGLAAAGHHGAAEHELEGLNMPRVASEASGLDLSGAGGAAVGEGAEEIEAFWDLVSRYQSRRMDEQRCPAPIISAPSNAAAAAAAAATSINAASAAAAAQQQQQQQQERMQEDAFLEMLAGVQGSRMNDQRATLPSGMAGGLFPGFRPAPAAPAVQPQVAVHRQAGADKENLLPDDAFFDMLMRCQATRLDEQRTALPPVVMAAAAAAAAAPTMPEDDVFGQMAAAVQAGHGRRFHQQQLPEVGGGGGGGGGAASRLFSKLSLKKKKR